MIKKSIDAIKNNVWKTVTIIITVFSLIGGVWALEDRYSNKQSTQSAISNLQTQQENFQKSQHSFQTQQELSIRERKIEIIRAKLEFYSLLKDEMTKEIANAQSWMDLHPEERTLVSRRVRELEKQRDRVQIRVDSLMEKLSEVE